MKKKKSIPDTISFKGSTSQLRAFRLGIKLGIFLGNNFLLRRPIEISKAEKEVGE